MNVYIIEYRGNFRGGLGFCIIGAESESQAKELFYKKNRMEAFSVIKAIQQYTLNHRGYSGVIYDYYNFD